MLKFKSHTALILTSILILMSTFTSAYKKPDVDVIRPEVNAYYHNNVGLRYLDERCYYAAIQEFKIAISLAPETQAASVYYKNLGDTYMYIGYPAWAEDCYNKAINLYSLNFEYYKDLAKCYKAKKAVAAKLKTYSSSKNPLAPIMVGLLKEQKGDIKGAITTLDTFTMTEPDLLITPSVKSYVKELVKKVNK